MTMLQRFVKLWLATATMLALLLLRPGVHLEAAPVQGGQPNVVFLFSDEHRYHSMGHTEEPWISTPNLDRMAETSMSFTNAISSNPICVPFRAMAMVGQWPYQTGLLENTIPRDPQLYEGRVTVADAFRSAGYTTGYVGKWHLPQEYRGFDYERIWQNTDNHWDSYYVENGRQVAYRGYNAIGMTDQGFQFIEDNQEGPFLLMISWNPPHADFYDAPDEYKALYECVPLRANVPERVQARWQDTYAGYVAHISAIDAEVGRMKDKIAELGLAENTIIVYTSDHGSMMGSQGRGNKRHPFEESIRVPFLVHWPGMVPAGQSFSGLFSSLDIMPSLMGLAGVPIPDSFAGEDFSPWMRGEGMGPKHESLLIMHISEQRFAEAYRGVRTEQYTYAVTKDGEWLLFDNLADPYQTNNLVRDSGYAWVRTELRQQLDHWLTIAEDPFFVLPTSTMHPRDAHLPLEQRIEKAIAGFSLADNYRYLKLDFEQAKRLEETLAKLRSDFVAGRDAGQFAGGLPPISVTQRYNQEFRQAMQGVLDEEQQGQLVQIYGANPWPAWFLAEMRSW